MTFRVGLSDDLFDTRGEPSFGRAPFCILDEAAPLLAWERLPAGLETVTPELTDGFDALYLNVPKVAESSFGAGPPRTRIIARHGVGYDTIDVAALNRRGIILTNTPLAVRRPVATAALTFMLALAQKLLVKDRLTREGRWAERNDHMGIGLTGRTLGLVGAGSIGREIARVAQPFEMRILATDPYADPHVLAAEGIELAGLHEVLSAADFVVIACLLTPETRHLIGERELREMKPTAYLINVARGPILDEAALVAALRTGTIAGAGLDVFEDEPVAPDNPLLSLPNTIVSPHALCWTDENFGAIARAAMTSIVDALSGRRPVHVVNPECYGASPPG